MLRRARRRSAFDRLALRRKRSGAPLACAAAREAFALRSTGRRVARSREASDTTPA
ncbi:Hypothetical protein A7982_02934 [Minicystis rosea]|nr:Hypothetical protein A7982_02934 [Minicystis rosea]